MRFIWLLARFVWHGQLRATRDILVAATATLAWAARPEPRPAVEARPSTTRLELLCNDACRPSPSGRFITHGREGNLWIWDVHTGDATQVSRRQDPPAERGSFPAAATTADGRWVTYAWRSPDNRQALWSAI